MLVAVIAVYVAGPRRRGRLPRREAHRQPRPDDRSALLFVGFFFAFAVKAPMVPVHTWLPDAATEATPATATLLVGVLDKVGTYGMIRFCLQLFPEASQWATPVVIALAVISVIYGALLAIGQTDMMRLIAYTSISHFGFIVLGIFALTNVGEAGSTLYMVNHGFSTAALFLFAGDARQPAPGSKRIPDYGGWQRSPRCSAGIFLVAGLSASRCRAVVVRVGVPRPGGHVHALPGGRGHRDHRHRPGRALHPAHVQARHDRAEAEPSPRVRHRRTCRCRRRRGRPAHRLVPRARLLPEAGARPHQPGRGPDAAATSASPTHPDQRLTGATAP